MNAEHKEILKHSGNYLMAMMASRALSFISIPVLTYLLSVEDYGVFNVFLSTTGVAGIILTLNSEVAISRYYYESKGETDFKRFVGSSLIFTLLIFFFLSTVLIFLSQQLADFMKFERLLTICIIPYSLFGIINSVFQQIYQPLLKSRKIAVLSCVQSYSSFIFSIIFILLLSEKKYYGLVLGAIVAMLLVGTYIVLQILKYTIFCLEKKYIKYILNYSLPYLPYSLSSIIIIQFGNLIIGQQEGFRDAGQYSFASNIALLMMVLISLCHSAWNPYYFRYMNEQKYDKLDNDYHLMWRATLIFGAALSLFAYEIGIVFARPQFNGTLFFVPLFVGGYLFYQWSYVYIRNVMYAKKMIWNAIVVISSGVLNIILNTYLIQYCHSVGVAISFSLSYLFMLIFSWLINRLVIKQYAPRLMDFIAPLFLYMPVFVLAIYFKKYDEFSCVVVFIKCVILMLFILIVFRKEINYSYVYNICSKRNR